MAKSVKLADIASQLDVSVVTVSKALSGQKGVSEEMRDKIRDLAREMGYVSLTEKRIQEEKRSYNIGVIISGRYCDTSESFYWLMYQEVAREASSYNSFSMLEIITFEDERDAKMPRIVNESRVDGLIVIGRMKDQYLDMLNKKVSIPMVFMDFYGQEDDGDSVITDNFHGMYRLTNYLISMGHKEIAYVGTLLYSSSITDRYFGYRKAMFENGLPVLDEWIMDDRNMDTGDREGDFEFKFPEKMPTAFACNSDLTADVIIQELAARGYSVPDDISIVGFDNYVFNQISNIGITTYAVDVKSMAKHTIDVLIRKISGVNYQKGVSLVTGKLVIKDSVKKI